MARCEWPGGDRAEAGALRQLRIEPRAQSAAHRNPRNGTTDFTDKKDFSTQSRQGGKTRRRKELSAPLRLRAFAFINRVSIGPRIFAGMRDSHALQCKERKSPLRYFAVKSIPAFCFSSQIQPRIGGQLSKN
jgi:hypothetical protein